MTNFRLWCHYVPSHGNLIVCNWKESVAQRRRVAFVLCSGTRGSVGVVICTVALLICNIGVIGSTFCRDFGTIVWGMPNSSIFSFPLAFLQASCEPVGLFADFVWVTDCSFCREWTFSFDLYITCEVEVVLTSWFVDSCECWTLLIA